MNNWLVRLIGISAIALCGATRADIPGKDQESTTALRGEKIEVAHKDLHISYNLDPSIEKFFVHVPAKYDGKEKWGLIVFINSSDSSTTVPEGWGSVLAGRKLLFVAPQNAGNDQEVGNRLGLAVMAAIKMLQKYNIDPARVYASGFSGGARLAGCLGFYHPDLFKGTIQCCGSNFPGTVPMVLAKPESDPKASPYGIMTATHAQIDAAKQQVRFVITTGPGDFRHGNLMDLYNGGYKKEGYQAALFDLAGTSHQICDGAALGKALDFIERK